MHAPRRLMEVHVQRSRVLATGGGPTEVPLTVFDRFAPNLHVPIMFAYHPPLPDTDDIVAALSAALRHFPTLAGRLGYSRALRRPCIQVGGPGGMLVVEATVPTALADHLPLEPSTRLDVLRPPAGAERDHVFMVQINRFACGGAVVVSVHHHHVADGRSMGTFFNVWARALWGDTLDHLPIYDRSWLRPRSPPRCEFDHWGTDFLTPTTGIAMRVGGSAIDADGRGITNVVLHYTEEYITKLKDEVGNKYSSFETLLGHLWRKMAVARGLRGHECTMLRVSVNGRRRMNPPAPDEFFGNLVLNAYPKIDVRRLLAGGLAGAAATVHDAVQRVDGRYFQSFVDFGELHGDKELVPVYDVDGVVPVYDAEDSTGAAASAAAPTVVLEVDNWLSFRIEEIGGPLLCGFLLPWLPFEGSVVFMPAVGDDRGVHVFVTLLEEHAAVLRQISHSLDDVHFVRSAL